MKKWIFAALALISVLMWRLGNQPSHQSQWASPEGHVTPQPQAQQANQLHTPLDIPAKKSHSDNPRVKNQQIEKALIEDAQRKIAILNEILDSRNDNDPRLDREFNHLSPQAKVALEKKYSELPPESRNKRGTIVFLLGRNIASESDLNFMKEVLNEPTCLSLSDCSQADQGPIGDPDLSNGIMITLNYPKITALKSLEQFLLKNPGSPLRARALEVLSQAEQAGSPVVRRIASSVRTRLNQNS